jgi:hypothetical protein
MYHAVQNKYKALIYVAYNIEKLYGYYDANQYLLTPSLLWPYACALIWIQNISAY